MVTATAKLSRRVQFLAPLAICSACPWTQKGPDAPAERRRFEAQARDLHLAPGHDVTVVVTATITYSMPGGNQS